MKPQKTMKKLLLILTVGLLSQIGHAADSTGRASDIQDSATGNKAMVWFLHDNGDGTKSPLMGIQGVAGQTNVAMGLQIGGSIKSLNTYSAHSTTKTTTTVTGSNAYLTGIAYLVTGSPSSETITTQDKSGTPRLLVNSSAISAAQNQPTVIPLGPPILMTGGIDVITGGTTAGTLDIWITYWQ